MAGKSGKHPAQRGSDKNHLQYGAPHFLQLFKPQAKAAIEQDDRDRHRNQCAQAAAEQDLRLENAGHRT